MKTVKKILFAAVITFIATAVFAQNSQTEITTNGIFSTDVDKFVDVNEWSEIKPENGFGMFTTDGTSYNLGFAKQFSKVFWGSYFSGDFGNYSKTVSENSTTKTTTENEANTDATQFRFDNLFGFNDMGVSIGFSYADPGSSKTESGDSVNSTDRKRIEISAMAGWKNKTLGRLDVIPYIFASYIHNNNNGTESKTNSKVTNDTRNWTFELGAGGETVLSETELMKGTLSASLFLIFTNPVDKDYSKDKTTGFYLPVAYECLFTPVEKFSFGIKAGIENALSITENDDAKTKIIGYRLVPTISAGFQYDTLKKIILNAGVSFAVPSFAVSSNEYPDGDKTAKTTSCSWDGNDGAITFSSGFQFVPVKNLIFDCNWAILANIFGNNMTSNYKGADIWGTVNNIIVHNITVQISYKF